MAIFDVFNGDADGICALLQLRLSSSPCQSTLITGVKREINLLRKVSASPGDSINVFDISLDKNRQDLVRNLHSGATVLYVDHHFCGTIPEHKNLNYYIDTHADTCSCLLINQYLQSKNKPGFPLWAITGAFGDNLNNSAQILARELHLNTEQSRQLQSLGIYINYNSYGASLTDLLFAPDKLFQQLLAYSNPLQVIQDKSSVYNELQSAYEQDLQYIKALKAEFATAECALYILPDKPWARRISGIFSNHLVNQYPDRAHAVLTQKQHQAYIVSVRAALNNKQGADELCRQFDSGGGRKAAAGINHLAEQDLTLFIQQFQQQFS